MVTVRLILKVLTYIIYACFGLTLLTFPMANLLEYLTRQTRLFSFQLSLQIEDVILPGLLLAVLYSLIMALQRRLQPTVLPDRTHLEEEHLASP